MNPRMNPPRGPGGIGPGIGPGYGGGGVIGNGGKLEASDGNITVLILSSSPAQASMDPEEECHPWEWAVDHSGNLEHR